MKHLYLIINTLCFLIWGCNKAEPNEEYLEILYFKTNIMTPLQVDCNTIYGYHGLRKIKIKEKNEIDIFKKELCELKISNSNKGIDVRYKLVYLTDTICMDIVGGIFYNGNRMKDSPKTLEYIKELIKKYKEYAVKRKDEFEVPMTEDE